MITFYKIQNDKGLFSAPSYYRASNIHFNKNGRIWKRRGDLMAHLNYQMRNGNKNIYDNCVVKEFLIDFDPTKNLTCGIAIVKTYTIKSISRSEQYFWLKLEQIY